MKNPKATEKLKALKRVPNPMRYGTRRLLAGDEFDAKPSDASILRVAGIAVSATKREPQSISAPPANLRSKMIAAKVEPETVVGQPTIMGQPTSQPVDDALSAAREAYSAKFGKRPYWGWDEAALREKMAGDVEP